MFSLESVSVVNIVALENTHQILSLRIILASYGRPFNFPYSSKVLIREVWSLHHLVERRGVGGRE